MRQEPEDVVVRGGGNSTQVFNESIESELSGKISSLSKYFREPKFFTTTLQQSVKYLLT